MIDFSTLQGLEIPEGVVTQITDASGRVLWAVSSGKPIVLEVEKVTSNTYVSSTSYTSEQFILLDIYPKASNSTVKVTYGGLTKTLTFTGTNAQQVYFGTYGGKSDSVETPTNGTLTVEGDCIGVGPGSYNTTKSNTAYCQCITGITEWGGITIIPPYMFYRCANLALTELPNSITSIGDYAFYRCANLALTELPNSITSIGDYAFYMYGKKYDSDGYIQGDIDTKMPTSITLPATLENLGDYAFCYEYSSSRKYIYVNNLTVLALTPPIVSQLADSIEGVSSIIVPKGCGEVYKSADGWSQFANKIVEAS